MIGLENMFGLFDGGRFTQVLLFVDRNIRLRWSLSFMLIHIVGCQFDANCDFCLSLFWYSTYKLSC